ncbi:helix-turn-helix transcriptional regulator [Spirillospora sp. NPDC052269]
MEDALEYVMDPRWVQAGDDPVDAALEQAVVRVIETMREKLGERLTVDDMARAAMFSKFHFSRVFQRITGVSPGRFLSAMRLQEAKRLLLTTSLSITEITYLVGYSSVGTFSTRFKEAVGLSPTEYRRLGGFTSTIPRDRRRRGPATPSATVAGHVRPPDEGSVGPVFVGLFPDWIPQGSPVSCTVLRSPGPYELDRVPPGTWHVLAHAMPPGLERALDPGEEPLIVGANGPITIRSGTGLRRADLRLRPMRVLDPPVLMALYDVRVEALDG